MCRKMLHAAVAVALLVLPLTMAVPAAHADDVADLFTLINNLRVSIGRPALVADPTLTAAAQRWSAQMSANNMLADANVSSQVPDGWSKLGENVAAAGDVQALFDVLKANPDHYAIMTDPEFTLTGVALVPSSDGTVLFASEFLEARRATSTTTSTVAGRTTTTLVPAGATTTSTTTSSSTSSTTGTTSTSTSSTTTSVSSSPPPASTDTTVGGYAGPVKNTAHRAAPWIFSVVTAAVALLGLIGAGFTMRAG